MCTRKLVVSPWERITVSVPSTLNRPSLKTVKLISGAALMHNGDIAWFHYFWRGHPLLLHVQARISPAEIYIRTATPFKGLSKEELPDPLLLHRLGLLLSSPSVSELFISLHNTLDKQHWRLPGLCWSKKQQHTNPTSQTRMYDLLG